MVEITCYGGVGEIGGNKILIEDNGTRIWLDFGMSFGRFNDYFEEFMQPRGTHTGLKDYFEIGLLPDVEGLYAPDLLQVTGRDVEDPEFDGVLLSHAHDDHAKYISFLHPDIPVYMSETTYAIRDALETTGRTGVENRVCSYREREANGSLTDDVVERNIETFRTGRIFSIGEIEVEPVHVDHSIPGAMGFILHTSEGSIVYTGDLRLHGRGGEKTKAFVSQATGAEPIGILAEGTRITDMDKVGESEQTVKKDLLQATKDTKGLVVVDYSYKDLDRFKTLIRVANETNRTVVVGPKAAYLYRVYAEHIEDAPGLDDVLFHLKRKSRIQDWEKPFYDSEKGLGAEEIGKQQKQFILAFNQWKLNELIDVTPKNATYVRSMSEPYNEEMAIDEERVKNWIDYYNMGWVRSHCSGHAPGDDLKEIITDIDADIIYPIHTEHPDAFTQLGDVEQPVQDEPIEIGEKPAKTVI